MIPDDTPGDKSTSTDALFREIYDDLRRQAELKLHRERAGHTLSPTALVHEAWLRLGHRAVSWSDRRELFFAAARVMRQILIDAARSRSRDKRGGNMARVTLGSQDLAFELDPTDMIAVEDALGELAGASPRAYRVAQLTLFVGLSAMELADLLEVSVPTIHRDLAFSRAFLGERIIFKDCGPPSSRGEQH